MIAIDHILISDEVVQAQFVCELNACKGACCWEGDFGAPLEEEEKALLEAVFLDIRPFLRPEGVEVLEREGRYQFFKEKKEKGFFGTTLMQDGACAYLTFGEDGIAQCGIEKAWAAGATEFRKPISCHLYPVRVKREEKTGFEALNYDRWDICSAACDNGARLKVPLYQFLREALIRKYGSDFYEALDQAAKHLERKEQTP